MNDKRANDFYSSVIPEAVKDTNLINNNNNKAVNMDNGNISSVNNNSINTNDVNLDTNTLERIKNLNNNINAVNSNDTIRQNYPDGNILNVSAASAAFAGGVNPFLSEAYENVAKVGLAKSQRFGKNYPDDIIAPNYYKSDYKRSFAAKLRNLSLSELFIDIFRLPIAFMLEQGVKFLAWKHFLKFAISIAIGGIMYYYLGSNWIAMIFAMIAVVCFIPMFFYRMLGMDFAFTAMILLASAQGFQVGFIMGKVPNIVGRLLTFQLELDFLYEFFAYIPIALVASFVSLENIVPVGLLMTLLYTIGYIIYHKMFDMLGAEQWSYAFTNCLFNMLMISQLTPFLIRWGYG